MQTIDELKENYKKLSRIQKGKLKKYNYDFDE